jgi:hypothetical protein
VDGDTEEDPRNKRYLSFGFGADSSSSSSSSSSGSGGGSGNFLFDIIRVSMSLRPHFSLTDVTSRQNLFANNEMDGSIALLFL